MKYKIETPDGKNGKDLLVDGRLMGSFAPLAIGGYSYVKPKHYPFGGIDWPDIRVIIAAKHIELNSGHNFISLDAFEQMKEDNPDCGLHIATIGGYEMVIGDYRDKKVLEAAQKYAKAQIMMRDLDKMPALEYVDNRELIGYCEISGKPIMDDDSYLTDSSGDLYFLITEIIESSISERFKDRQIEDESWEIEDFGFSVEIYSVGSNRYITVGNGKGIHYWTLPLKEGGEQ